MRATVENSLGAATSRRSEFLAGVRDTVPLVVGATPFAIIFGGLAKTSGLSFAATVAMSLVVFAGSAQFIAMGLVAAGTGWFMIVVTTFVINLRHLLYGATMVPHYRTLSRLWQIMLSFWLTDETFAVAIRRYQQTDVSPNKHWYNLGSALIMYVNWNVFTLLGLTIGRTFPRLSEWGLDFAMPVTFIGMVIPYLVSKPMWAAVIAAGSVSLLSMTMPHKLGLISAAVAGVVAGMVAELLTQDKK